MKTLRLFIAACLMAAGWQVAGFCQSEYGSDAGMESSIDQSESSMDQGLGSEMRSEEAESQADIGQMDMSMDTGGQTN